MRPQFTPDFLCYRSGNRVTIRIAMMHFWRFVMRECTILIRVPTFSKRSGIECPEYDY